jgi:hypothetical protein
MLGSEHPFAQTLCWWGRDASPTIASYLLVRFLKKPLVHYSTRSYPLACHL